MKGVFDLDWAEGDAGAGGGGGNREVTLLGQNVDAYGRDLPGR